MKLEYTIPLPNNKEIPLIVKCSVFTALRMMFNKFILRKPTISCNSLHLKEDYNMLTVESNITYDNKFTIMRDCTYVSLNFTPSIIAYVSWSGNVSIYSGRIGLLYMDLDRAAKHLAEYSYAFVRIIKEIEDHKSILSLLTLGEPVNMLANKIAETDDYIEYYIKYADECRPELYY